MFTALEDFDFGLLQDSEFKEDSVREVIISPILRELGYTEGGLNRIVRSRSLRHPFVKTGSGEREIRIVPDYLLLAANKPAWILDAKSPKQNITSGGNVEQTYFYAIHPEIRSRYYALCNGREFALFDREGEGMSLYFHVSEMNRNWDALYAMLGPRNFQPGMDVVYTDPPYGAKIQYLDLSTMWLAWLDLPVSDFDRQQEIIEGGRLEKTKEEYSDLMAQSIHELYRVLKYDRWMSFVFADKNPAYWHTIVETAEQAGFEYMGAVPQSNSTRSFKKVQHPSTVLSGQLIINFRKVRSPRAIMKLDLGEDATDLILETAEGVIAENGGATVEEINSELIIKGIELGFLDLLSRKYDDLSPLLDAYFDLEDETQKYHLPKNKKFKSAIPVDLRLRYFLLSYMKRQHQQGIDPKFDDIVQSIMPLLKNGITPEDQTILNVLQVFAHKTPDDRWRLRDEGQMRMDGF